MDDDSFHPLGQEWESHLEAQLAETDYDVELGMELARDAQRVTAGELSEDEFHDRYHERVVEEFDVDDRPTEEAWIESRQAAGDGEAGFLGALFDEDVDRRDVLGKIGMGAGALGLGAWGTADGGLVTAQDEGGDDGADTAVFDDEGTQWGMTLDLEVCDGCLSCVVACQQENNWDLGSNWMYILAYDDSTVESPAVDDEAGTRDFNYLIRPCQHCGDAPCEKVCPTTARHTRLSDGLVLTDYDVCIGCRYCQVACPYGVNYFQWGEPEVSTEEIETEHDDFEGDHIQDARGRPVGSRPQRGTMGKCTFCPSRQDGLMGDDQVGTTACEDACPPGAIQFGNMNDPNSVVRQYAENPALGRARELVGDVEDDDEREELEAAIDLLAGEIDSEEVDLDDEEAQELLDEFAGGEASSFRLLEEIGTNPNVIYLGNQPDESAEQVPGPVAYEDVGELDVKKEELDQYTVGL